MQKNRKIALSLYFSACFVLLLPVQALAYIDPSSVSFLVQALIGLALAIGAGVVIYWRKAKKKVADTLGIDENANKDVESDQIIVNEESKGE